MSIIFNVPSTLVIGGGASGELAGQVKRLGANRVLVVTDKFMMENGIVDRVVQPLTALGISVSVFDGVNPDPTDKNVADGLMLLRGSDAQVVIALGGGSSIDAAKAIAVMATNSGKIDQYAGYHKIPKAGLPLIAIPTTAGTGSEVTKVAVITNVERQEKMLLLDFSLLPRIALVDYLLTMSMPRALTSYVGIDTLIHAIEAYVSRKANPTTDLFALSCIKLVAQNLLKAYESPNDEGAREAMMLAACHGGIAFANSSVCLIHGMSRPLGAVFHLPHGLANGVLLLAATRFSLPACESRYAVISRTMGYASESDSDKSAGLKLLSGLETLNGVLNLPKLRDCPGIDSSHFEASLAKMATDALASGSPANNPVVPQVEEISAIYREAW